MTYSFFNSMLLIFDVSDLPAAKSYGYHPMFELGKNFDCWLTLWNMQDCFLPPIRNVENHFRTIAAYSSAYYDKVLKISSRQYQEQIFS
jgi:hypothetical protein